MPICFGRRSTGRLASSCGGPVAPHPFDHADRRSRSSASFQSGLSIQRIGGHDSTVGHLVTPSRAIPITVLVAARWVWAPVFG
jgi:hypothetical protein